MGSEQAQLFSEAIIVGGDHAAFAGGHIFVGEKAKAAKIAPVAKFNAIQLRANGMSIVAPSPLLKADMKKVGEVMQKEWLEKAGPEGKALIDAFLKP